MGLNWNEIKSRALLFSKTWADACNEDSQAKPFWIDFFEIFVIISRLKSYCQYFALIVYNNYPWPGFAGEPFRDKHRNAIEQAAPCVLDARGQFVDASLADLYNPLTIHAALLKYHQKLDVALNAAYQPSGSKKPAPSTLNASPFCFYQRITSLLSATKISKRKLK